MDARDIIKIGMSAERTLIVPPERTVGHFVPGMPMVYATPMMILEMEMTSGDAIRRISRCRLGHGRHRSRYPPPRRVAGRRHRADHGEGDRGGAKDDPLRGRSLRRQAPASARAATPAAGQSRGFQQAPLNDLAATHSHPHPEERRKQRLEGWSHGRYSSFETPRRARLLRMKVRANYFANSFERCVAAATARVISGSGRPGPSAPRAPRRWCRRAR